MSPTRSPAMRRPATPMAATPVAPMTHEITWCWKNDRKPSHENPASTVMNPGGWSAPGMRTPNSRYWYGCT